MTATAEELLESIDDEYQSEVSVEDIEAELESFKQFGVTGSDAENGALGNIAERLGVNVDELRGDDGSGQNAPLTSIADINTDEEWVSVEAEVVDLWDNNHEDIVQAGLISDESGETIKFVVWDSADEMMVSEGEQFRFDTVVTNEWQGNFSISVNSASTISFLEEELDVSSEVEKTGAIVALQSGSGLIERDESNDRYVRDPSEVESTYYDMRLKMVLDNGEETFNLILGRELTEGLTGIHLDEAKTMAREAMDKTTVAAEMEPDLMGRYFTVSGEVRGDYLMVNEIEPADNQRDIGDLLVRARSL